MEKGSQAVCWVGGVPEEYVYGERRKHQKPSGVDDKNRCKMGHDDICWLFLSLAFEATAMSPLLSVQE